MAKKNLIDGVWAGSEASLDDYLSLMSQVDLKLSAGWQPEATQVAPAIPRLLTVAGNVGVVAIAGPLTNNDSPWNEIFGITSYGAIREAMIHAANDPAITSILLDINSGGGAVSGVSDTGNLIRQVNENSKPVVAFTDGGMLSAAYWLGCSAGQVFASNVAHVGSIGVLATHVDRSEQLRQDGLKVSIIRAGEFKALANSIEPLTEAARAQIQEGVDAAYQVFVGHVAEMRDTSYANADKTMAQGREFFGDQAVKAGLVDGITSFDALMVALTKSKP